MSNKNYKDYLQTLDMSFINSLGYEIVNGKSAHGKEFYSFQEGIYRLENGVYTMVHDFVENKKYYVDEEVDFELFKLHIDTLIKIANETNTEKQLKYLDYITQEIDEDAITGDNFYSIYTFGKLNFNDGLVVLDTNNGYGLFLLINKEILNSKYNKEDEYGVGITILNDNKGDSLLSLNRDRITLINRLDIALDYVLTYLKVKHNLDVYYNYLTQ